MAENEKRLTQLTASAGWAAKIGPGALAQVLCGLPKFSDPNLLVGFDTSDDACVYRLSDTLALVQTVDFFPPMVDDPYAFGQIAAANALSDLYAMGAQPRLAMNLLCIPGCLSQETVGAILAGGADKVLEAGAVLAGGHTIQDNEPKYGLCVSGFVAPEKIYTNSGAQPGDRLLLTKPLGTGVLSTAMKAEFITPEEFAPALESMRALNRAAAQLLSRFTVHACTDVTGFGLIGHACELAQASGVTIRLFSSVLPLLPKALQLAEMGLLPAGAYRNGEYTRPKTAYRKGVPRALCDLLCDPQTSGGLLACIPADEAAEALAALQEALPATQLIGEVAEKSNGICIEVE